MVAKVGVQVAGVAAAAGDFLLCGGDLTQGFGVVGDVGQDDQDVHALVECQVFRSGQRHTRGGDTFHGRIVCQVDEQNGTVDGAGAAEFFHEEFRFFKGDADGGKDDGEVGRIAVQNLCLPGDLGGQLRHGAGRSRRR